jgi:hypothetical protein
MSYQYFRRRHPEWPKRLGDAMGRQVELRNEITTRGGDVFKAGTLMEITSTHRGKLALQKVGAKSLMERGTYIRQVWLSDVRLLPATGGRG